MGMKSFLIAAAVGVALASVEGATSAAEREAPADVVAIDVLLHPDQTMLAAAAKANQALRADYPAGFALDALHTPHISMIQRFVRRDDLKQVEAAVAAVFAKIDPTTLKLEGVGYYSLPVGDLGLAGIVVKPTAELRALQDQIVAALEPFAVEGTAAAFVPPGAGETIAPSIVEYVNRYVPERTGEHFNPHVTVGLGTKEFVRELIAAPFPAFAFKPTGASIYHLGNFDTAAKELWRLPQ